MAQITCQNITLGYEGHAVARDISFTVNSGDYLCIVGENGSGKSTLMKTILGLLPPLAGKILTGDHLKQTEIGYLPQQTEVQRDFPASVAEIVLSGCQGRMGLRPFYGAKEKELTEKNMDRMRIREFSKRCYRELSVVNSNEYSLRGHCVRHRSVCFWMSLCRGLTQRSQQRCMRQ